MVQPKSWKIDVKFEMWNIRSICRSGSLTTIAKDLVRYKLELMYRRFGGTKGAR